MAVDPTLPPPSLAPCPWCGNSLEITWRKYNPRASCRTEGCFGFMRVAFALDDPQHIEAWNYREAQLQPEAPTAELGALQAQIAKLEASNFHLSARVDELRELLQDAKRAMTELHLAAIPDESTEGIPAIIPPEAFRNFVDAHAMLCFCMHQRGYKPPQEANHHG